MTDQIAIVIYLWIILDICFFATSFYFFILGRKAKEDKDRRQIALLVCFIFLFIGLSRLFHIIAAVNEGSLTREMSFENQFIFLISQIFFYIFNTNIIFYFERKIRRVKNKAYSITFITIILIITYFIFHFLYIFDRTNELLFTLDTYSSIAMNIFIGILALILAFMYLRISFKTAGEIKKKAFLIFLGFFLLILSYTVNIFEIVFGYELISIIGSIFSFCAIPSLILGYK